MEARIVSGFLACTGLMLVLAPPAAAGEIKWTDSYSDAKNLAQESGRLMLIDFTADW
jgi:hypothetical protein